ncbi:hypothetical protein AWC07_15755 [Mycobacterium gastri]|uniref:SMP-30/Gluconolactonase/LRE-like region domain-containing protein n=1 Tax=Mycobacterium gastri TaxID=1777 RepID=A0A1X1V477_MYCGS|nr:hypothetical protein AWC07_15755 [Mycobacterium gastri]
MPPAGKAAGISLTRLTELPQLRRTKMRREVAIKVLAPELATEPGYRERFRREAYGVPPQQVAVDQTGAVYVSDSPKNQILKLPAGAGSQTVLPLSGLNHPEGVAVDAAGNLYVTDSNNNRVLKLAAH